MRLLSDQGRGLVNLNRHPLPTSVGLAFRVEGEHLRLLPGRARHLRTLLAYMDVTLELGAMDLTEHTGWRVVVTGHVDEDLVLHPTDVTGYRLTATRAG